MAIFKYQAIDTQGKQIDEHVDAESEAAAMQTLRGRNLTVLELRPGGAASAAPAAQKALFGGKKRVSMVVVLTFYEQLGFLIKAGIPVFLAIRMLSDTFNNPTLTEVLKSVIFELSEGFPLSSALMKFPESFPPLHTNLIGVGEKSGNLDGSLAQLVELVKEQQEIRGQIVKSAAYPVFLLALSGGLVIGLLLFIFPQFEDIFKSFDVKLPLTTEIFMAASRYMRANMALIFSSAGIGIVGIAYFFQSEKTSETRDKIMLATPILRDVFISMFVALFAKTLTSLLKSGIPLMESLIICKETIRGKLKGKFFDRLIATVKEGDPTSKGMEGETLIPEMARQLITVGEKTGNLDKMMENIFLFYKKRYGEMLGKATAVLQPILLLFAAGLIALVGISLFVPLFKLSSSMRKD